MPIGKPEACSTPTVRPQITRRKGIKDVPSVQSPINGPNVVHYTSTSPKKSPRRSPSHSKRANSPSNSENESDELTEDDELNQEQSEGIIPSTDKSYTSVSNSKILIVIILLLGILTYYCCLTQKSDPNTTHKDLYLQLRQIEKHFDKQDVDFWRSIRVNIEEITTLKKPSTVIFLYENNAKSTMKEILNRVANVALCELTKCENEPIRIPGSSLNSSRFIDNYGILISTYREPLTRNGVLIVENLEQVPGKAAQAFHSFCDDYDPVVDRALILFTLKVDRLPVDEYPPSYVRKVLSKIWNDIKVEDKFNPLFSRISGTILLVRPE